MDALEGRVFHRPMSTNDHRTTLITGGTGTTGRRIAARLIDELPQDGVLGGTGWNWMGRPWLLTAPI